MLKTAIIGYSGHALAAIEVLRLSGHTIIGYADKKISKTNREGLEYLGNEEDEKTLEVLKNNSVFISIGDNSIRRRATTYLQSQQILITKALHPAAFISASASIEEGVLVCRGACVNPYAEIKEGSIINTASVIEHECYIGEYTHIAPGAVLAGNVHIGQNSFIGANTVIKQGVRVGNNVIVGAGSVILKDIPDNETWFGNPGRKHT